MKNAAAISVKHIFFGCIIGIANIIPGVSGGTFALILGIYPKLLEALDAYDGQFIKDFLAWFKTRKAIAFKRLVLTDNFFFLSRLAVGAVLSIVLLSQVIKYCLEHQYEPTYGFFLGLIVFSIPIPYRLLSDKKPRSAVWFLVGLGLTLLVSVLVDPSGKLLEKSRHYQMVLEGSAGSAIISYGAAEYIFAFFVGMIAISAMVLPGISGSFVLLLFGLYYQVISAISRIQHFYLEDIIFLSILAAGSLVGLVVFVKLFNYLFQKYRNQTIFFLIGLMVGSLYALWPFKEFQLVDLYMKINDAIVSVPQYKVYGNSLRLWQGMGEFVPTFVCFSVGGLVMMLFNRYETGTSSGMKSD
jgi:putative membrane protein